MSHYFSRVQLIARPRDNPTLYRLGAHGEAYRDHALVWQLFPGDGVPRDFVFRREDDEQGSPLYFVVSRREPQPVPELFRLQAKPYSPRLAVGEIVRFTLRANPTVSLPIAGGRSKRHDVLMHAKRQAASALSVSDAMDAAGQAWIVSRAPKWGLDMQPGHILQSGYRQHRLRNKGRSIEYSSVDYQGIARVVDPALLLQALLGGVGHSKGFGCGLLMVRRAY